MLIHLSERGYQRLQTFPRIIEAIDRRVFAGFSEEDRVLLKNLLERIRLNLGDEEHAACADEMGLGAEHRKEDHLG